MRNVEDDIGTVTFWDSISSNDVSKIAQRFSDGVVVLDRDLRYRYLNELAAEMMGRSVEDLVGKHIWTEFPDAVGLPVHLAVEEAAREQRSITVIERYDPLDSWFENQIYPLDDKAVLVIFRDVTTEMRAKEWLREQGRRLADAERIMRFGVWSSDLESGQWSWSEQMERIHGLQPGEFDGTAETAASFIQDPDDRDRVRSIMRLSIERQQRFAFEERITRADGAERMLLCEGRPVLGSDGAVNAVVGVCHDITERRVTEQALGASERRMRAIIDNTPSVITVKDLEGRYVMTNAESGRVFGVAPDDLLGQECRNVFAAELAERQRANDLLAAAEREPVYDELVLEKDGEPKSFVTVTFALPDEQGLPSEICTIATDVTDSREREAARAARLSWQSEIDSAIKENRMRVFAQPIVDLATGAPTSKELLVRMLTAGEAPEVLPPSAFLPAAERFGLIQRIDLWMIRQALERTNGTISEVNLSAVTLCDQAARAEIVSLLAAAPERACKIIFEITETAVAEHLGAASEFAEDVTNLGCRLALDDFGTGFGSLTYLNNLPLSYIKIDMSFVRALAATPRDDRLVKSIIDVAGIFSLKTIAEGIEDESTLELLRDLGTDYAQGFHLGRPAPLPPLVV